MAKAKTKIKKGHNLGQRIFLLSLLVKRNIKNKYYRSVIGIVWSVLNPLLNTLVMWLVFSQIFNTNVADVNGKEMPYVLFILSGNIVFGLMSEATSSSVGSIEQQRGLLLSTPVPMEIFPMAKVFSSLVSFLFSFISMLALMVIFVCLGTFSFCWEMLLIITIIPALVMFSMGISFFLSTCYVFFRDIQHIYSVILTLWRYLTPVFYSLSRITSETLTTIMKLNPMYQYLTAFRGMLVGDIPSLTTYIFCYGFGIISLLLGLVFARAVKNKISSQL